MNDNGFCEKEAEREWSKGTGSPTTAFQQKVRGRVAPKARSVRDIAKRCRVLPAYQRYLYVNSVKPINVISLMDDQ
jgi:hypothetical protein